MMKIILASQSPRRKELMQDIGLPFQVHVVATDEKIDRTLPIGQAIENVALEKAMAVTKKYPDDLILAADTVVRKGKEIMGKPKGERDAFSMLSTLSGTTHQVITGVAIISKGIKETFHVVSEVTFHDLTQEDIEAYISTKEYEDKAGAYAIQGKGKLLVAKIQGDYYNIVGLPIALVYRKLKKYLHTSAGIV